MTATAEEWEARRSDCLQRLNAQKSLAERNRLGQFATPRALADQIVQGALRYLPGGAPLRFLEPGFGMGPFYASLRRFADQPFRARGFETDGAFVAAARRLWQGQNLRIDHTDFTSRQPPTREASRFNLLLCNPPYQRHHHLNRAQKQQLQQRVAEQLALPVSGLAGLYAYFLLLSQAWMTRGGAAGWLLPAEFLTVSYGGVLREFLRNHVTLQRVHRFDAADLQFSDALVSSVVVFFTNAPPPRGHRFLETRGHRLDQPHVTRDVALCQLSGDQKWNSFDSRRKVHRATLSDWFAIKRGIATGCNRFFIVSAAQAAEWQLPAECLQPILPSPRYLHSDVIGARSDGGPDLDRQQFLVSSGLPLAAIRRRYPQLFEYLQTGLAAGVAQRYLCSRRRPWYSSDTRQPAPFLCSYMGRPSSRQRSPFRFFWNQSRAVAPNVYLMLYPRRELAQAIACDEQLAGQILSRLQQIEPRQLIAHGRTYGGGLHKIEPRELGSVEAPGLERRLPPPVEKGADKGYRS